jgi:hypothetical protein
MGVMTFIIPVAMVWVDTLSNYFKKNRGGWYADNSSDGLSLTPTQIISSNNNGWL